MADLIPLSDVQPAQQPSAAAQPNVTYFPTPEQATAAWKANNLDTAGHDLQQGGGGWGYVPKGAGTATAGASSAPSSPLIPLDQITPAPQQPSASAAPESTFQFTSLGPLNAPANAIHGFTDQFGRALSLGLTDKLNAAVPAVNNAAKVGWNWLTGSGPSPQSTSDIYHARLAQERAAGEAYAANQPIASKVATTAGTLATIPLMAPASGAAVAPTLLGRVGQGAKIGATMGTLSGFGGSNDESLAKTAVDTAEGTGIGAATGAAAPVIAEHVVSPLWNWVFRQFSPAAAGNQAVARIMQRVGQDAEGGGPSAQDMLDLVNAGLPSKPITLADLGGNNVLGEAGRVARAPGPGKQTAIDALNARDAGAGTRISGDVNAALAPNGGTAFDTTEALLQARSAAARPAYDAAMNPQATIHSDRLQQFLDDPSLRGGLARGIETQRLEALAQGRPFDPNAYTVDIGPDGSIAGFKGVPNMRTLDAGKRGLDAQIAEERNPITGRLTQKGAALDQVRQAYLSELDKLNPDYAAARASWSGPSQSMDAVRAGQAFTTSSPEEVAAEFNKLSPGDKEFYKLGVADTLKKSIAKTGIGGDEAKRLVGTQWTQGQLRPLFPDQASFDKFIAAAKMENRMFDTRLQTIGNSATAGRVAEDDAAKGSSALGGAAEMAAGAATGEHIPILAGGLRMLRNISANRPPQDPAVNAEISRMLFDTNPQANRDLLARIIARQNAPSLLPATTIPLASLAARGVPPIVRGYQGQ